MPNPDGTCTAIRVELARTGIRQSKLADALGIDRAQVTKRMAGEIDWRLQELRTIAQVLGVPLSTLIPDEPLPTEAAS